MAAKPPPPPRFRFAMLSHLGRVRKQNEDVCLAANGAFLVCDGMGGAAAGEIASRLAADTFLASLASDAHQHAQSPSPRRATPDLRLHAAIQAANQAVFAHSRSAPGLEGMGTTLVALLLESPAAPSPERSPERSPGRSPSLTLAHVGDSRCYRFRAGTLTLLTQDHSLVEEQLRLGEITAAEAEDHPLRNIITRAIGSQPTVEPEIAHLEPQPGDLFLLASDGLTRELADPAIAAILQRTVQARTLPSPDLPSRSPSRTLNLHSLCRTLIDEANDAGGADNITVLLLLLP